MKNQVASKITEEVDRHTKAMAGVVAELKAHILSLPDNPRIKRMGNSPSCFIMSSKDLGNNWSAEHHDFKKQYQMIVEELEKGSPDGIISKLKTIINSGKLMLPGSARYTLTLHPDVVEHLVKLCGFRWTSNAAWPTGTCPNDASDDSHDTKTQALGVCRLLNRDGFGGERKLFPVKTWVEVQ